MAANLIKLFNEQLGSQIAGWASSSPAGPDPVTVQKGLEAVLPVLLGALVGKAGTKEGAAQLAEHLKRPDNDGRLLEEVSEALQGDRGEEFRQKGKYLLDELIGTNQPALVGRLAEHTGLKKNQVARLMQVVLPLLLNLLGQRFRHQGNDLGELMNTLSEQAPFVQASLPAKLAKEVATPGSKGPWVDSGTNLLKNQPSMQSETNEKTGPKGRANNWLPMLLGALIVVALIYFLLPEGNDSATPSPGAFETETPAPPPDPAIKEPPASLVDEVNIMTVLLDMVEDGGSMVNQTYVMESSDFAAGSAEPGEATRTESLGLAYVLGQNPGMEVRITAHTADNPDLAAQRAQAIRQIIVEEGNIPTSRVFANGSQTTFGNTNRIEVTILAQ